MHTAVTPHNATCIWPNLTRSARGRLHCARCKVSCSYSVQAQKPPRGLRHPCAASAASGCTCTSTELSWCPYAGLLLNPTQTQLTQQCSNSGGLPHNNTVVHVAQTNPWCFQLQVQRHTRHISRPATSHAECAATDARGLSGLTTHNISSHAQRQGGMQHADSTSASAIAFPATQVPLASLQAHCTLHHGPANRDAQTCQSNSWRPTHAQLAKSSDVTH